MMNSKIPVNVNNMHVELSSREYMIIFGTTPYEKAVKMIDENVKIAPDGYRKYIVHWEEEDEDFTRHPYYSNVKSWDKRIHYVIAYSYDENGTSYCSCRYYSYHNADYNGSRRLFICEHIYAVLIRYYD